MQMDLIRVLRQTAVLPDAVNPLQVLRWVQRCIPRVFVLLTCLDDLTNQWVLQDQISEGLVMDSLKYSQLVGSIQLQHTQQVQPDVLQLGRVLIDQLEVIPNGNQHPIEILRTIPVIFDVLVVHRVVV